MGVDLSPGYHRTLDTQRPLLTKTMDALNKRGVKVFKKCPKSTLPVPVFDPIQLLPNGSIIPVSLRPSAPPPRHKPVSPIVRRPPFAPQESPKERRVVIRPRNGKPPYVAFVPDDRNPVPRP